MTMKNNLYDEFNKKKYDVVVFEKTIAVRFKEKDLDNAEEIIRQSQDKYENLSHYVRCALIRLNRLETERLFNEKKNRRQRR